jgi:hypothetical protein
MRVWDISPKKLCRNHLLGEHNEIHAIYSIITSNKEGYSNHPEVKRWEGKLNALYKRHEMVADEMRKRGYRHMSPLDPKLAKGKDEQDIVLNTKKEQMKILQKKNCECRF